MRPTLWLEVKRVLGEAVDVPRDRREEFVQTAAPDTAVRVEVLRLLAGRDRVARATIGVTPGRAGDEVGAGPAAAAPCAADVVAGALVGGRYALGPRLGVGAFGAVHRAEDRVTGDAVAVKIVAVVGETEADALRREISVLRRSRLPGVVELLDDGVEDGWAYIVMRLVEGAPFPGVLPSDPPSWEHLAPRALALVEILGRLHWLGVLHRDVKPENVLVDGEGRVTVVDLGVAHDTSWTADLSPDGIVGTPVYLAPERFRGGPATAASDLYSVGVMLYETLARRPMRASDTLHDLVGRSGEVPPPLRGVAPGVPAHVAETIDLLVRPDPAQRPPSARVVAAMLRGRGAAGACVRLPQFDGRDAVPQTDLRALFAGHDRLFHIPEDGARELWRRTLGRPGEVAREIETWIESGIARWEDERVVLDRTGIERLESCVESMLPRAPAVPDGLTPAEREVAAVLELAACPLRAAAVAEALSRDVPEVEEAVTRLCALGLALRRGDGTAEALRSIDGAASWPAARRRAVHAIVARTLPVASARRLFHLIAADAVGEIPAEAVAVGRRQHRDGHIEAAMLTASSGLSAARACGAAPSVLDELLLLHADAAIAASASEALDRTSVELTRAPHDTPTRRLLTRVCSAARLVLLGHAERALAETEQDEPLAAAGAARQRHVVRSFAARFSGNSAASRRVLAETCAWARRADRRTGLTMIRGVIGWRRYQQDRFASAAWLHARCAAVQRTARARITSLTDAASAYLEAGDLALASQHASRAAELAAEHRLALHEARATWIARSAAYRGGAAPPPDPDLVAALQDGITPILASVGLTTEATILLSHGDAPGASVAARAGACLARRAGHVALESMALGLTAAAEGGLDDASFERFVAQVAQVRIDPVRCQALALVVRAAPDRATRIPETIRRGVRLRGRGERSPRRQEVLSEVEWSEILERVPGIAGGGGAHVHG